MDANKVISEIKDIKGTDVETGLEYCASDEQIYVETVQDFLEDDKGSAVEDAFIKNDINLYHINAHALKNLCYTIGINFLGDKAKELDDAAKVKDFEYIKAHHEELMVMYRDTTGRLKDILLKEA
ncbi:MAG: hypothetical protein K6G87_18380 [Butyrivibrio sp.]|uniref:hypothetical protein n=1 Tax=Butyrivibrio sp. TaxID=28121 RepID=UPI0025D3311F|nr:hypothetical protein [Butyrivibrio sp.]MCR5773193.1 hypothetical protein [Butyrivibrio sp.]